MSKITDAVYNQGVVTVPPSSPTGGDTGTLPFTGADLSVVTIAATIMVACGLGLRRAFQKEQRG